MPPKKKQSIFFKYLIFKILFKSKLFFAAADDNAPQRTYAVLLYNLIFILYFFPGRINANYKQI